jgi:hypothetical protein
MSTNHDWVYRGFEGPTEDDRVTHFWICSRCDSRASSYMDPTPPKPTGLSLSKDRKKLLNCKEKMVENIQDA